MSGTLSIKHVESKFSLLPVCIVYGILYSGQSISNNSKGILRDYMTYIKERISCSIKIL